MFVETLRTTSEDPRDQATAGNSTGQHCMREADTSELETGAPPGRKRDTSSRNRRQILMIGRSSPHTPTYWDAAHRAKAVGLRSIDAEFRNERRLH
jgi:hypothetical protein